MRLQGKLKLGLAILVFPALVAVTWGGVPPDDPPIKGRVLEAGTGKPLPGVHVTFWCETDPRGDPAPAWACFKSVSDSSGTYDTVFWGEDKGTLTYSLTSYDTLRLQWSPELADKDSCWQLKNVFLSRHMSR